MKKSEIINIIKEELSLLTEQKPKKGDFIHDKSFGEYGVVNKVKGNVAYVKFPSTGATSFDPVMVSGLKPSSEKRKGKKVFISEAICADQSHRYEKEESVAPDHDGKAAPYGSGYDKVKFEGKYGLSLELNKIKNAINMFQDKIKKQGRITNARDEEHLKKLIALYKKMSGKGVFEAVDINDPVLVAFRASRKNLPKFKPAKTKARRISFDKYLSLLDAQTDIDQDIKDKAREMAQTLRDMEQEAEPEGGKVATRYGRDIEKKEKEYAKLRAKKAKIDARVEKYKMM